jgi:ribosomal protein S18 acetylase RimI-like enzyme
MSEAAANVVVRQTTPADFPGIIAISREVYPASPPWNTEQLSSHLRVFPEGQFVAVEAASQRVVGMAASLIVWWDDYDLATHWRDFTDVGMFTNHDLEHGRTLYGAEIMVSPSLQRRGIGASLYEARRKLAEQRRLLRIRAGARLRGYCRYADRMSAEEYVVEVVNGRIHDPTLTFQLKHGFHVMAVVPGYLRHDPESLGYAAVIEWINHAVAKPEDYSGRDRRFQRPPEASATSLTV